MIVLTVKTLDSQNHTFTVDDDITVEEFKVKIAETVNIPAETQRIIYCGRVLQDGVKLNDYDVNGKVVHLVQRPPPSATPPTPRSGSPHPQRRGFRTAFDGGNTMYLGSMAFPSNLMESQGIVPPPPSHSLAGSRLNVAKRMLRRAEAVIRVLENPTAQPGEQPPADENQEEEVTPIIEARVIVPSRMNEQFDEAMVLSAVQNSIFNAATASLPTEVSVDPQNATTSTNESSPLAESPSATPPEEAAPIGDDVPESEQQARNGNLAENASRTSEMAELLQMLNGLQARFAPFLESYQQFMVDDPVVPQENVRQSQAMLTRVSQVLHFLGHAYHSLSDIIIRVRTPPPRPLLCRPILIQHSAVVQTGIPIQVEAQFNLERPPTTEQPTTNAETTTTTTTESGTETRPNTTNSTGPVLFPFMPSGSMRVHSFRPGNGATRSPAEAAAAAAAGNGATASNGTSASGNGDSANGNGAGAEGQFNFPGNSSLEFFMELSPEVMQGNMNGPPPDILQSLMQMAGHIMNRVVTTTNSTPATTTNSTPTTTANQSTTSANNQQPNVTFQRHDVLIPNVTIIRSPQQQSETTTNSNQQSPLTGQNSQARGNTQTNPTTATYTRSTPRPHVHLAQQAMQGGFDPFLPCNSHHVTVRRRSQQQQQSTNRNNNNRPNANIQNVISGIINSIRNVYGQQQPATTTTAQPPVTVASTSGVPTTIASEANVDDIPMLPQVFGSLLQNFTNLNGPTIADILQQILPDNSNSVRNADSILTDLVLLFSRHLTFVDIIALNSGNLDSLERVRNDVQNFFMTRILDGNQTPESINNGVERILNEMRPFFDNFSRLPTRDNIDMVGSIESLFKQRLPEIIQLAANLNINNMRDLVNQCLRLAELICALTLYASSNGQQTVEHTFQEIITSYMQDIPSELQNWTLLRSRTNLRHFIGNLNVPDSELQQYIVFKATEPAVEPENVQEIAVEMMECDEAVPAPNPEPESPVAAVEESVQPLPSVVIGSEPWHGQVPEEWVPIITRDVQRQRRQSPQAPFSDAYLSGMPSKRRKIVNNAKPQGSLPQVITESVRRAVTTSGLTSVAPLDLVAQTAGNSQEIQNAYRNLLRTNVQANLQNNEDFTPERFPNASNYFNNSQ